MIRFLILIFCIFNYKPQQLSYEDFLSQRIAYNEAKKCKEQSDYLEALNHYRIADKSIDNFAAPYDMAECYISLNKKNEALQMLRKAFQRGFPITFVDKDLFLPIWASVKDVYNRESKEYSKNVDTLLRKELDSIIQVDQTIRNKGKINIDERRIIDASNIKRLKEICKEKGWPGRKLLGFGRIPDPSILVIHGDEKDNLYFLEIAMNASLNNEASWFGTRAIMINLLWRFNGGSFNKLRHTFLTNTGELDVKRSSFQLRSLAKFLEDNPDKKIELVAFQNANRLDLKSYYKRLKEIKDILVQYGVQGSRVTMKKGMMADSIDDNLGHYDFGFIFL